ncbi:putative holin-like toxin [Granulicatella balaenopterae]
MSTFECLMLVLASTSLIVELLKLILDLISLLNKVDKK